MPSTLQSVQQETEAADIIGAMRLVRENPDLIVDAMTDPEGVMDRMELHGALREAVKAALVSMPMGIRQQSTDTMWWEPGIRKA